MSNNLLQERLQETQKEYLSLLRAIDINKSLPQSLDAMSVFWYMNKEIVDLALEVLFKPHECVVFTAGTYLEVDANEVYPFLMFGENHVIDDPIFRISRLLNVLPDGNYSKKIITDIQNTIANTIKIMELYEKYILVLPLRYIFEIKYSSLEKESTKVFLDLFNDIDTMDKYFAINSAEELSNSLMRGVEKTIIFSNKDDVSLDLKTRLSKYKEDTKLPEGITTIAQLFFFAVFNRLSQAVAIFFMTITYNVLPYIRDYTAQIYFNIILNNFLDRTQDLDIVKLRAYICFGIEKIFDRDIVSGLHIDDFIQIKNDSGLNTLWFKKSDNINYEEIRKEMIHKLNLFNEKVAVLKSDKVPSEIAN